MKIAIATKDNGCQVAGHAWRMTRGWRNAPFTFAWAQRPEARCHGLLRDAAATRCSCASPQLERNFKGIEMW